MAKLSDRLVKEFVRMTNDTPKKKNESFLYGTADKINEDGTIDVIFDGATDSTPCASSVSVAVGDRVLVMLKNRQATVTANVSNPTVNAAYLEAGEAKISGTIHAATYEDSTGNFTMEIGSEIPTYDDGTPILDYSNPTFKVAGYVGNGSTKQYLEISLNAYKLDFEDLPQLNISAIFKNSPDDPDTNEHMVGIGVGESGIHFYGHFPPGDSSSRVSSSIPWGKHIT